MLFRRPELPADEPNAPRAVGPAALRQQLRLTEFPTRLPYRPPHRSRRRCQCESEQPLLIPQGSGWATALTPSGSHLLVTVGASSQVPGQSDSNCPGGGTAAAAQVNAKSAQVNGSPSERQVRRAASARAGSGGGRLLLGGTCRPPHSCAVSCRQWLLPWVLRLGRSRALLN